MIDSTKTPKLRCLVVDDEYPARILLKEFIDKIPTLELVESCSSGLDALGIIQNGGVDLLFLDIQMPEINGVNFASMLNSSMPDRRPLIVFTTAYPTYAVDSYQLDALDYLLKPFSFERFLQCIGRAIGRLAERQGIGGGSQPLVADDSPTTNATYDEPNANESTGAQNNGFLIVKADHKIHRIRHEEIIYIEGLREYVTIFCNDERIIALESLQRLERTLPSTMFIRVHKSYIVRIDKIRSLYGSQLKIDGIDQYIPVGKSYKDAVQEKLFNTNN